MNILFLCCLRDWITIKTSTSRCCIKNNNISKTTNTYICKSNSSNISIEDSTSNYNSSKPKTTISSINSASTHRQNQLSSSCRKKYGCSTALSTRIASTSSISNKEQPHRVCSCMRRRSIYGTRWKHSCSSRERKSKNSIRLSLRK